MECTVYLTGKKDWYTFFYKNQ